MGSSEKNPKSTTGDVPDKVNDYLTNIWLRQFDQTFLLKGAVFCFKFFRPL